MSAGNRFGRVAAWAARHARPLIAVSAALAIVAALGATRLPTDAGVDTLVDSDSPTAEATQRVREEFGEEPVVVLVKGELPELVLGDDLFRLLRLEGCLSGKVPKGADAIPGPCTELAEMEAVEFLTGPGTFLNESVVQIDNQLRRLAEHVPAERFREYILAVATRYGITSVPSITNEDFVATVIFDLSRPRGTPKARLSYLFPNAKSAQIVIRLRPDLSEAERHRAIGLIEAAVEDTTPRRQCKEDGQPAPCFELEHGSYIVSGAPVVIDGVSRALKDALLVLFAVALVVMALVLLLVFRSHWRLLPLGIGLAATALTFGLLALVGGSLTMASIAALPILIGLAVDYMIQFQARFDETRSIAEAATRSGPTIGAACLATIAGFLALQLSPIPMVRGFGWVLIVGVAIAFGLALTAGPAMLTLLARQNPGAKTPPVAGPRVPGGSDRRRSGPGRHGLGRWNPGRNRLRHSRAGAAEHQGGRRPERAAGHDRGVRGVGREHRSRRPHGSRSHRVDGRVQETGAGGEWVQRRKPQLQQRRNLPGTGVVGLPGARRRSADCETDRCDSCGAVAICPAAGRADRSPDRRSWHEGVDLLWDQGAVAGGSAEAGGQGAGCNRGNA
ncbi:MAG: MMPL family transporter [Solirubrobacterales bacterium]